MSYASDMQQREAEQAAADKERRNRELFEVILRTPFGKFAVGDGEANYRMLLEYCGGQLTIEKAAHLLANPNPGFQIHTERLDKRREQLIADICELEHDPTGRRLSEFDARQRRIRYESTYSLAQLRSRYVDLYLKKEWAKFTSAQIHSAFRAAEKTAAGKNPWLPYEMLPAEIEGLPAPEALRHFARHEYRRFEYICKRYGHRQVDAVMNQR